MCPGAPHSWDGAASENEGEHLPGPRDQLVCSYPTAGVPGEWNTPGCTFGFGTQTLHSCPSGSTKNRLNAEP